MSGVALLTGSASSGFGLSVNAAFFTPCPVGVNADKVGIDAAEMLLANLRHGGAVDEYLQDQVATSGASLGACWI